MSDPTSISGRLEIVPALDRPDLLAPAVVEALGARSGIAGEAFVAPIDPELADTAAFCDAYGIGLDVSANCVVVCGKRGEVERVAACVVLATTRADVNGFVRRHLDARKASFMAMDDAVATTGMEYGGITPIGLPDGWPVLVAVEVATAPWVIVGSGIRGSKLVVSGALLAGLPGAEVHDALARPA